LRCRWFEDSVGRSCSRQDPLATTLGGVRGGPWVDAGGIVVIVRSDVARVESDLVGGRVGCPGCGGVLRPWGHGRGRVLRGEDRASAFRPRRARCGSCLVTQVLLPDFCLARRRDRVEVIGSALSASAAGRGWRRIAANLGVPPGTVRGWLGRFRSNAEQIRAHFTRWAYHLDVLQTPLAPAGSVVADAVEAIGVAARAATLRFGPRPGWGWAAAMSGGWLLATQVRLWPSP
jgi:hypothetical protein